jgi:hypothetical protein
MNKKILYRFDDLTGIFYKNHNGNISIDEITASWEFAFQQKLIPADVKGFILDYTEASFNFPIQDFRKISAFYRQHLDVFKEYRIAIITSNPKDMVIPILIAMEDVGYHSKEFSSLENARKWVLRQE